MSTDITLEAGPRRAIVDFDAFVTSDLETLARATALLVPEQTAVASALHAAVEAAYSQWKAIGFDTEPRRFIFRHATTSLAATSDNPDHVSASAVVVARHVLRWPESEIAAAFNLSAAQVATIISDAESAYALDQSTSRDRDATPVDLAAHMRSQLAETAALLPDVEAIKKSNRSATRRKWLAMLMVGLAGLVFAASFIANSTSSTPIAAAVPTSQPEAIEPASVSTDPNGEALAGEIGNEPRPDLVPFPELITTDGDGGFVGVRSPSPQNRQILFTRSADGDSWTLASRWNLGAEVQVERLERSGDHYVVLLANTSQSSPAVIGTMAVSTDLVGWTVLELAATDITPRGLVYDQNIQDISVSGDSVLALVTTTVEIDFAALSLSEGYTCGRTITEDKVSVNLCNGEFDVLSLSGVSKLPDRNRLFVSRNRRPFEPVAAPFSTATAARLTAVNGAFAVTDETGVRFATSTDADTWQTVTAGKPPFPVQAAASNNTGQLVGLGTGTGDIALLFQTDGQTTSTFPLSELVGEISVDAQAVVASGPLGWVVYLFEAQTRAWLLTSLDGISWQVVPTSPPTGDAPRVLVGDDEVLIQWVDSDDQIVTLGVPLS